jgi:hypothetical protein
MEGDNGFRVKGHSRLPSANHSKMAVRSKLCPYLEMRGSEKTSNVNGQIKSSGAATESIFCSKQLFFLSFLALGR